MVNIGQHITAWVRMIIKKWSLHRGDGSGVRSFPYSLGSLTPSCRSDWSIYWKGVKVAPQSGWLRLLQCPDKVLYFET